MTSGCGVAKEITIALNDQQISLNVQWARQIFCNALQKATMRNSVEARGPSEEEPHLKDVPDWRHGIRA